MSRPFRTIDCCTVIISQNKKVKKTCWNVYTWISYIDHGIDILLYEKFDPDNQLDLFGSITWHELHVAKCYKILFSCRALSTCMFPPSDFR